MRTNFLKYYKFENEDMQLFEKMMNYFFWLQDALIP